MADMKEVMMEKGDKLALGGALLLLIGYAAYAFGFQSDAELNGLQSKVTAAKGVLASNPAPTLSKTDYSASQTAWGSASVTEPKGAKSYVAMFKTQVSPKVKSNEGKVIKPQEKERYLTTPILGTPDSELGQVKVKWTDGKAPAGEEAATISEYEVWRQEAGKQWAKLVSTKTREHLDTSVEPKKKYAYKVKSRTKDKLHPGAKDESPFSEVREATVPSGVAIIYTGGTPQAALITVRKFMGGEWKEKKYVVSPKDEEKGQTGEIGKIEKEKDQNTNKYVEVDYRTGFILNEIRKDRFKFKRTERRTKMVEGHVETEDVEVDAERDRYKLFFTNDEGKPVEQWAADEKEEEPK